MCGRQDVVGRLGALVSLDCDLRYLRCFRNTRRTRRGLTATETVLKVERDNAIVPRPRRHSFN